MEFRSSGNSSHAAFYPLHPPVRNRAAGGLLRMPGPSQHGGGCQGGAGWAEAEGLADVDHEQAQRDGESLGQEGVERETERPNPHEWV